MANKKKETARDKKIEKKRQKNSARNSAKNSANSSAKNPAKSTAKNSPKNSSKRRSKGQPQNNDRRAVRSTGLDERYAYGSFSFDEYNKASFGNDDSYRLAREAEIRRRIEAEESAAGSKGSKKEEKQRKTAAAEANTRTRAEIRREKKRYRRRVEADVSRITPKNRSRLVFGFGLILLMMTVLIFRMGYWQIVRADELRTMAASMQKVDTEIDPVRGTIYDSQMNVLAEAVTEYELYGYSQYLYKSSEITQAQKDDTVRKLAALTGQDQETIRKKLSDPGENLVLLADGLSSEQVDKAEEIWDSKISVKTKAARYYPNGAFAAQILGGVNADNVGRSGLEYEYNSTLAGVKGRTVRTTDRDGNTVSGSKTKYYEAKDGYSIVTTIDSVIQHFVESALETGMKKTGASQITCIVMDPKTGDILAMASTPEFDPNNSSEPYSEKEKEKFEKMTPEEQTEYLSRMWTIDAVSSVYEPGSTFKLIAAASALDSGSANDKSRYECNGSIRVANYNLHCLGLHGKQSLKEAVGNSCNPALAQVALDMGAETFYSYIDMFGFNDKTGVDLPGETNSIVKDPATMGDVDLATTGYGQGIAVTPLQILCAVSSLGNDGVLMKPKLVKKILDKDGNVVTEVEDTAVRQVISHETADKMRDIMEYYVAEASGDGAYVPGYRVGGKTGTANLVADGKGYASNKTNTSFVAMAPMDDPQISIICIVYRPTKMRYGNYTAGPIIKEVIEKTLQYKGVERKYTKSEAKEVKKNKVEVPDVTGINSKDAIRILKNNGLSYKIEPEPEEGSEDNKFLVVDQNPKKGTRVDKDSVVYIYSE